MKKREFGKSIFEKNAKNWHVVSRDFFAKIASRKIGFLKFKFFFYFFD